MTNVFVNEDGTDWPKQVPGWTVQSAVAAPTSVYTEPVGQDVFPNADGTGLIGHTPAITFGWTVQSTGVYAS